MDSSSHTTLNGSNERNARGRKLEDFIFKHGLEISNKGYKCTYESHLGKSIIDITLTTPDWIGK